MTPQEADALYEQIQRLTLDQMLALFRWIYLELGRKVKQAGY